MRYYTGIGSRETPLAIKSVIKNIVYKLNNLGYVLRSGGADGADSYFEEYANACEIYLPWKGFNNNDSELYQISEASILLAKQYHPAWDKLSQAAQKLMARNGYQVLGEDLLTPTEFVICWTKDGKDSGGTGQAIRIAKTHKIPVCNLYFPSHIESLSSYLKKKTEMLQSS